jgi:hypothetical protein
LVSKSFTPSPKNLRDVALASVDTASFVRASKEFVDMLVAEVRKAKAEGKPRPGFHPALWDADPGFIADPVVRALVCGMGEHLALISGMAPPEWSQDPSSILTEPFYAGGPRARPHLLADTPGPFRRRLVFCGDLLQKYWTFAGA